MHVPARFSILGFFKEIAFKKQICSVTNTASVHPDSFYQVVPPPPQLLQMLGINCLSSPSPRECPGLVVPEMLGKVYPHPWRLARAGCLMQGITAWPSGLHGAVYASELPMGWGLGETSEITSVPLLLPYPVSLSPLQSTLKKSHKNPHFKCHFQGTWLNRQLSKEDWPKKMLNKREDAERFFSNWENHQKYIFPLLIGLKQ